VLHHVIRGLNLDPDIDSLDRLEIIERILEKKKIDLTLVPNLKGNLDNIDLKDLFP